MKYISLTAMAIPVVIVLVAIILTLTGIIDLDTVGWVRIGVGSALLCLWGLVSFRKIRLQNHETKTNQANFNHDGGLAGIPSAGFANDGSG